MWWFIGFVVYCNVVCALSIWLAVRWNNPFVFFFGWLFGPLLPIIVAAALCSGGSRRGGIGSGPEPLGYRTYDHGRTYRPYY